MRFLFGMSLVVVMILALSCAQQPEAPATAEAEPVAEPIAEVVEMVAVSVEGDEFDPPVELAQIPDGSWYCDMGTVHFARAEEGDGECPKCGMKLVLKHAVDAEVVEPEAGAGHGADDGHAHG